MAAATALENNRQPGGTPINTKSESEAKMQLALAPTTVESATFSTNMQQQQQPQQQQHYSSTTLLITCINFWHNSREEATDSQLKSKS